MKFYMEIKCNNAAFGSSMGEPEDEIARILRDLALRLEDGDISGRLRDINGNTVGSFGYTRFSTHLEKNN